MDHSDVEPPKLLIFDLTRSGDGTATGELKETLLHRWPTDRVLHVHGHGKERVGITGFADGVRLDRKGTGYRQMRHLARRFDPDCILYRPVPENLTLHRYAMKFIQSHPVPLVTWIMDDWPMRLRDSTMNIPPEIHGDFEWLLGRSEIRLCISEPMRSAFTDRYGYDFLPVANGVDPQEWPQRERRTHAPFTIRYAGSLADNMSLESLLAVARAVEEIAESGVAVRFQINTRSYWDDLYGHRFRPFSSCRVSTEAFSREAYREFLQDADLLLVAYNFDEATLNYVRYSLANKLPECLISGAPLLVYGPARIATVGYMQNSLPEAVVSTPDQKTLEIWIRNLIGSADLRMKLSEKARALALAEFRLSDQESKLATAIRAAVDVPFRHELWVSSDRQKLKEESLAVHLYQSAFGSPGAEPDVVELARDKESKTPADLLKIRINRFDLSDLDGVISTPHHPRVILAEQISTGQLGTDWRKIADHLAARGYSVLISEWRPTAGSQAYPAWRSIRMYPCELDADQLFVSLIAVAGKPDIGLVMDAIERSVVRPPLAVFRTSVTELARKATSISRSVRRRLRSRIANRN